MEDRALDPPHCPTLVTAVEAGPEDRKRSEAGWEGTRCTTVHFSEIVYQRSELGGRSMSLRHPGGISVSPLLSESKLQSPGWGLTATFRNHRQVGRTA